MWFPTLLIQGELNEKNLDFHSNLNFSSLKLKTFSIMLYKKKYELVQGESGETKSYFFAIRLQSVFSTFFIYSKLTFIPELWF